MLGMRKAIRRHSPKAIFLRKVIRRNYYVQYYYEFGISEENNEDSKFIRLIKYNSRPNNFDNKKVNIEKKFLS